jgi:MFS family permease
MPARQAFVIEMVGPDQVANAVALNSAMFNTARVVGPAIAGVAILAFGLAPAFLINAVSFLAVLAALAAMDPRLLHRSGARAQAGSGIREGLRYVRSSPVLWTTLLMVAVLGTFGLNYRVVLPLLARFEFGGGPGTIGLMTSVMAGGSVLGALVAAGRSRPTRKLLVGSAAGFGVAGLLSAVAPDLRWALVTLFLTGIATITFMATANAMLQLASDSEMRGRVMALHGITFLGTTPIGGLVSGWLAEVAGPRSPLWVSGVVSIVAALVGWLGLRRARAAAALDAADPVAAGQGV